LPTENDTLPRANEAFVTVNAPLPTGNVPFEAVNDTFEAVNDTFEAVNDTFEAAFGAKNGLGDAKRRFLGEFTTKSTEIAKKQAVVILRVFVSP